MKGKVQTRRGKWGKIRESRYNKWNGVEKGKGILGYLKWEWKESRWRRVARFRMENKIREGRYWEVEEKRKCRMCEGEET